MKKSGARLVVGALAALGAGLLPALLSAQAPERQVIAARVVSVSPDHKTVVINRGKGENVVPGSSCFIRPNRGPGEAKIEWDVYYAKGVVQTVSAASSTVRLTVVGPNEVRPRDYCGVEADIPAAVTETDLGQVAVNDIVFLDRLRQAPLFTLNDLIKDASPKALEAIYEKLRQEIRSTPEAVLAENYVTGKVQEGRFSGLTREEVFRSVDRKQVEDFVGYRAWFGGRMVNYDWPLIDSFVNWIETGGQSGDSERRKYQAGPAMRRAADLLAQRKFEAALSEYGAALLIDPDHVEAKENTKVVNRLLNLQKMLEDDPKDVTTRYALGKDFYFLRLDADALEQFLKARELGYDTAGLSKGIGYCYAWLGKYAEALRFLEPLAAGDPGNAELRTWVDYARESEALARQGPNVPSLLKIGRIWHRWGDYDAAIEKFNEALEIAPLDTEIWANINRAVARRQAEQQSRWAKDFLENGKRDDALSCWDTSVVLCEDAGDEEGVASVLKDAGTSLYDASLYDEAISFFSRILDRNPKDADSHFQIARCFLGEKDYASAIQWAEKGVALRPGDSWGYNILGAVQKAAGDIDRAISNYEKAVEITPRYAEVQWNLGKIQALKGDYEKAAACFRRALEIDNAYGSARSGLVSLACVRETQEAVRANPGDNEARIRMAKALFNLEDYGRAISQMEEVVKTKKDVARALEQIGYCLDRLEKFEEGKARLEESYRLDPKPNVKAWINYTEARLLEGRDPYDPEAWLKRGEDSLYWEKYDDALVHFQKALDCGAAPDAISAKMELARKGKEAKRQFDLSVASYDRAQYEKAVEYGERSAGLYRELGAGNGEVNALLRVGWSYAAMFKHGDALTYYDRAGKTATEVRNESALRTYYSSLGSYYSALGEFEKSLDHYQKASDLWHNGNDLLNEAWALPKIGSLKGKLGDSQGKLELYEKALRLNRDFLYVSGEASSLLDIAEAHTMRGDFSKAIESYKQAQAVSQKHNLRESAMRAYSGLGGVYSSLGDIEEAQRYLKGYLDTAVALGMKSDRANALNSLGLLYLEGLKDYPKALGVFEETSALSKLIGYREMEGVAAANIAVVYSRQGKYADALPRHDAAMAIILETKDRYLEMQGLNEKGETLYGLKDYDRALDCQLKARELAAFLGARSEQWLYELAAGKAYEAKGDLPKAVELYIKAAETLKGIKGNIANEKLLKGFGEREKPTEVYTRLIGLLLKSGRTEEAFRYIEESKSKAVQDAFGGVKPPATDPELEKTLLSVDKMEKKKEAIEGELREERKKPEDARDPKKLEVLTETLAATEGEFNQWMLKLKFQNRKMYDALSIKPASLGDVQRDIPPGAVFLEYFVAPEQLYIFCIGKEFFLARSAAIGEKDLTTLVSRFLRLCQQPPDGGTDRLVPLAQRLYQVLIEPVDDIVEKTETIVVIPFGVLYYLPFQALVKDTGGRPQYLIERKRVCYTTSATFADILKNESRGNKSFMAFGNPDGSLPAATEEMQALQEKIFKANAKVFTAGEATKDTFFKQAKNVNILHLATHGVIETDPLESYLLFAGGSKEAQELTLREVAGYVALREKNSLVFLSACQTAKEAAESGSGSELITLAEAFAMAGAPTLIATLWEVEDNSTRLFAMTFYDAWANKKRDKLDALRAGQIALIRSAEYSHPFYWASFIMIGSWR